MGEFFMMQPGTLNRQAVNEIVACNETTARYGLVLSAAEATELVAARGEALRSQGRIEFGGGVINQLILAFSSSPYVNQQDYLGILSELLETFYYFKNETLDEVSDDDLIMLMRDYFNKQCQGSLDLLQGRELEQLAHNMRYGLDFESGMEGYDE